MGMFDFVKEIPIGGTQVCMKMLEGEDEGSPVDCSTILFRQDMLSHKPRRAAAHKTAQGIYHN